MKMIYKFNFDDFTELQDFMRRNVQTIGFRIVTVNYSQGWGTGIAFYEVEE